ncbi:hypothetical protein [Acetivibrio straminisolvens]|uniref:Uncharacterized protein n=1 Tax=Acetivibrio straminisolvens JCM 21531 TaxID=1294263 RepID=W4V5Z6_9FIRM|nr:hypothetical protein [Acetivibrio straminisolvens]GAE88174.1 hypothetical protein JCM21531_1599 [Acetivibrio straminisolvens JCM 21531]
MFKNISFKKGAILLGILALMAFSAAVIETAREMTRIQALYLQKTVPTSTILSSQVPSRTAMQKQLIFIFLKKGYGLML